MGSTTSTTANASAVFEFIASMMIKNKTLCNNSVNVDQIIDIGNYNLAEIQAYQDSYPCRKCIDSNSDIDKCRQFCEPGYGATYSNISQDANLAFSATCEINASSAQDLANKVSNELEAKADKKDDSIGKMMAAINAGGADNVSSNISIRNRIESLLSVETITECHTRVTAVQKASFKYNSASNIHQSVAIQTIATTLQETNVGQQMSTDIDNAAKASSKSALEGIFTFLSSGSGIVFLVIAGLVVAYFISRNSGGGGGGGYGGGYGGPGSNTVINIPNPNAMIPPPPPGYVMGYNNNAPTPAYSAPPPPPQPVSMPMNYGPGTR